MTLGLINGFVKTFLTRSLQRRKFADICKQTCFHTPMADRNQRAPCTHATRWGVALLVLSHAFLAAANAQENEPTAVPVVVERVSGDSGAAPLTLTGSFVARQRSTLSSELAGVIATLDVDVGDRVNAGDALLALDDTLARLTLESAEAGVREAEARAQDALRQAEENSALRGSGAISSSVIETSRASAQVARAALESQRAAVREQCERVERHRLKAPFAGVVANRMVDVGEWVSAGTPALELVDVDSVWLEVAFPQTRFFSLSKDTPIQVTAETDADRVLQGRVVAAVPVADPASRTMRLRIAVDDDRGVLVPGASAVARFAMPAVGGAVQISRDALVRRPDGTTGVWVVRDDGGVLVAAARRVTIGRSVGESVEIREGLNAGDQVVVRGNETLSQGQRVRLTTATGRSTGD